ncbi:MAG TPA: phosphoribosylamine--glycine ligase [Candidatus Nitrosocosmicus sp.]|nr:phosphoribosylamine--glycine ligase [Candidatus Nitrosocosmicus sp.]
MPERSVLIVGGGGREAALVDKYSQSPHVDSIYAVPGNDMMQDLTEKPVQTFSNLRTTDTAEIVQICQSNNVTLVDIAQDNAVEAGLGDKLLQEGIVYIGPTREAGRVEWDKGWAREFMRENSIPHPTFAVCTTPEEGYEYLDQQIDQPWVIKTNGLAEGKGVLIVENTTQAKAAINEIQRFGGTYLIETFLRGEEASIFVIYDGDEYKIIGSAQDHKRVNNYDEGPNTGGMGAYSSPMIITPDILRNIQANILDRTIKGMKKRDIPYKGILYLGGMISSNHEANVIEFNARWGDPEAQVIIPGILNDLFELSMAVAEGNLANTQIRTDGKVRVAIAGTSRGYPGDYSSVKGKEIFGLDDARSIDGVTIYGAGVKKVEDRNYVNGGRLFYVVGEGNTIIDARQKAYEAMSIISIDGNNLHFRTDIGWRDVQRIRRSGTIFTSS